MSKLCDEAIEKARAEMEPHVAEALERLCEYAVRAGARQVTCTLTWHDPDDVEVGEDWIPEVVLRVRPAAEEDIQEGDDT